MPHDKEPRVELDIVPRRRIILVVSSEQELTFIRPDDFAEQGLVLERVSDIAEAQDLLHQKAFGCCVLDIRCKREDEWQGFCRRLKSGELAPKLILVAESLEGIPNGIPHDGVILAACKNKSGEQNAS